MKASEARKLTEKHLKTTAIEDFVKQIDEKIVEAATKGQSSLHNPFSNLKKNGTFSFMNGDVEDALKAHYRSNGYKVEDHPDPDPGHPASGPYTTLSW